MKLFSVMWPSYIPLLKGGCASGGVDLDALSTRQLQAEPRRLDEARRMLRDADLVLLYRTGDPFWDALEPDIREAGKSRPVVVVGGDPSLWGLSTVDMGVAAAAYQYVLFNGAGNFENLVRYLRSAVLGEDVRFEEPQPIAWEGIFHPRLDAVFSDTQSYLEAYRAAFGEPEKGWVGLLCSRSNWVSGNLEVERALVEALEGRGLGTIPVFYYSIKDGNLGNRSGVEVIESFLAPGGSPLVHGIVKLTAFFLANRRGGRKEADALPGAETMKSLGIPLFGPIISYRKSREEWLADPQGLGGQAAWSIAMPEFEGVVEPMVVGAASGRDDPAEERYEPIPERMERLSARVAAWVALGRKPNAEKKVAFILHNNPCVSTEASVGGGAHLDTLESVARILEKMREAGYRVEPPGSGKALIDDIMRRKAISEFRWTTVDEIVAKGGALDRVGVDRYLPWFGELPPATRERMREAWGDPPGEERDGVPAAMVHEGKILITGVRYGNAVVCAQPKRGCAGARCDGQVCRILHDPDVPPPHQYVATYKWLSREFCADVIVHVGTHGNLEFLPGKATGLSSGCFPDIGIDTMPHLYIYNADNPPEGTVAKRRALATLVDHLQTVMVPGELYGDLESLERLMEEYRKFRGCEPARAHRIAHMIADTAKGLNLVGGEITHDNVESRVAELHDAIAMFKGTRIPKGMHVFGDVPGEGRLGDFVYAIARYGKTPESLRGMVARVLPRNPEEDDGTFGERVETVARALCLAFVEKGAPLADGLAAHGNAVAHDRESIERVQDFLLDLRRRTLASDEIGSLLDGFDAGYVEPGPSGLMTRGRPDILPTGRNFYSLDPHRIPSRAAWETGRELAEKTLDKYLAEEGRYPGNIAFYWQCTDIMWSDGEGLAQMFHLLGVRPEWQPDGRVRGFSIVPVSELERPRIDLTVRVSGITRDNFPSAVDLLDEAVQAVAALPEPPETNFVRKHTLERLGGEPPSDPDAMRQATFRIFASRPGTYQAGTQLAVYASAWKTEEDLSDVFLYWNGYAYGKGTFGVPAHAMLKESLKTVKLSFNRTVTDEYDLTGCCCHFGTHGGLINAARTVSGGEVRNYYGDTREQGEVAIRTLEEEIRRIARGKILNPVWIEGMKRHGYKGAGEISRRVGRLYGWQATAKAVDGAVFDDVARTFLMDGENRGFFEENNPWALEEIARRLLEAAQRGLWRPSDDVRDRLRELYIEIEGWIEERMEDARGEFQGGSIDIRTAADVEAWRRKMKEVLG